MLILIPRQKIDIAPGSALLAVAHRANPNRDDLFDVYVESNPTNDPDLLSYRKKLIDCSCRYTVALPTPGFMTLPRSAFEAVGVFNPYGLCISEIYLGASLEEYTGQSLEEMFGTIITDDMPLELVLKILLKDGRRLSDAPLHYINFLGQFIVIDPDEDKFSLYSLTDVLDGHSDLAFLSDDIISWLSKPVFRG